MKPSLPALLAVAFLSLGVAACTPKPAATSAPPSAALKTDVVVQTREASTPGDASIPSVTAAADGQVTPPDALRLMLLHLLVVGKR
jgi:hypothetical protein